MLSARPAWPPTKSDDMKGMSAATRFRETDELLTRLKVLEAAIALVRRAREQGPVEIPTNAGRGNSLVHTTAVKSGNRRIILGNLSLDDKARTWYETDDNVQEYHFLPHKAEFRFPDEKGILRSRTVHTFRFLVIYKDEVPRLEDWHGRKFFSDLRKSSRKGRYLEDPPKSYIWRDTHAEKYASSLGLRYALRAESDFPWKLIENARFLADYRRTDTPVLSEEIKRELRETLVSQSRSLRELISDEKFTADQIFRAIVEGVAYVDLTLELLSETENLFIHANFIRSEAYRVAREAEMLRFTPPTPGAGIVRVGDDVLYQGEVWTVRQVTSEEGRIERGGRKTTLSIDALSAMVALELESRGRSNELLDRAKRTLFSIPARELNRAFARLKAARNGGGEGYSDRSARRFAATIKNIANPVQQLIVLAGKRANPGNRQSRFGHPKVEELARQIIEVEYNTPKCGYAREAHQKYIDCCVEYNIKHELTDEDAVNPMGYTAFLKRVAKYESTRDRGGKRREYAEADIPLDINVLEPISGVYPGEVVYFDNTHLPVMTKGPRGENWGKVWLCAAIDGNTTNPCGVYVTYEAPSAKTVLMLLRSFIKVSKHLPRVLVVDGGPEFRSEELEDFCETCSIDLRRRPGSMPRSGTPIENLFAITDKQFVAALEGNSRQLQRGARLTTKEVDPVRRRVWEFAELARAIEAFMFVKRPKDIHPEFGGLTIEEYELERKTETGFREHTEVTLDENMMLLTSPYTERKEHRIKAQYGVYANGYYYWNKALSAHSGELVVVRTEPWCAGMIYVQHEDLGWIVATCRNRKLWTRTGYECHIANKRRQQLRERIAKDGPKSI